MNLSFSALLWLAGTIAVVSCSTDSTKEAAQKITNQPRTIQAVHQQPEIAVRRFLEWYRRSQQQLGSVPVVPASLDDGDTTNVYAVDFKEADRYLALFRASGFVSEVYLAKERKMMQAADSVMRQNPQTDGPPPGFDYDHIVCSQDPEADLEKLLRTKPIVTIKGNTAHVLYPQLPKPEDLREGVELEFLLSQQQGQWLINSIRPIFPD